jgi:hypothetical protein
VALPVDDREYTVMDLSTSSFKEFAAKAVDLVSEAMHDMGAKIPVVALREVIDNLIHAVPCSASIVLAHGGENIFVCDNGPGISRLDLAFEPGYSTATSRQRSYIRGVGLGLPLARDDLHSLGGYIRVESGPGEGTYVNLSLSGGAPEATPFNPDTQSLLLTQRQNNILFLLSEGEALGPSGVASELGIGLSTAYRDLIKLQDMGLVEVISNGKRFLSELGRSYLQSLLSL